MRLRLIGVASGIILAAAVVFGAQADKIARLRNPAGLTEQAPARFKASFDTSRGVFVVDVHRDWAPLGADRFYELVKSGFYDDARFFRNVPGFMVQWGLNKDPKMTAEWREKQIPDDPVKQSNLAGFVTCAKTGQP